MQYKKEKIIKRLFNRIRLPIIYVSILSVIPAVMAKNISYSTDIIKIVTVESKSASPIDIRIKTNQKGVHVLGKVRRKKHTSLRIRGHVDVDLLSAEGVLMEHKTTSISATSTKIKHNRFSKFNVTLSLPSIRSYTVRVTHTKNMLDHRTEK